MLSPVHSTDPAFMFVDITTPLDDTLAERLHFVGRYVAAIMKGRCDFIDDQERQTDALGFLLTQDLTQYGTVMIQTHGTTVKRVDGSEMLELLMFRSKNEDYAEAVWSQTKKISGIRPIFCVDYRYKKGGAVLTTSAQLIFGLYYDYFLLKNDYTKYYGICVTSTYFESRYANSYFPGTVMVLDACDSLRDYELSSFFISHGCSCCLGFREEILMPVADVALRALFAGLMTERESYGTEGGARFQTLFESQSPITIGDKRLPLTKYEGNMDFTYEGCGWLSGELRYDDLTPVPDGIVIAWRLWDGSLQKEAVVRSDSQGRYEFERLPWGVYLLQAFNGKQEVFDTIGFSTVTKAGVDFYFAALQDEESSLPDEETSEAESSDNTAEASGEWVGLWVAENGESIEVYEQHDDCIYITYRGHMAAGGMFTSYYTLYYDDESHLSAAEEDSVLELAGWRYRLILEEDRIVMESRYPDKYFYPGEE